MDQINNKPESELPWEDLPDWQDYIRGPVEWYDKDYCYAVHACNAYPKLIAKLKEVCEHEGTWFGSCEVDKFLKDLGEWTQ